MNKVFTIQVCGPEVGSPMPNSWMWWQMFVTPVVGVWKHRHPCCSLASQSSWITENIHMNMYIHHTQNIQWHTIFQTSVIIAKSEHCENSKPLSSVIALQFIRYSLYALMYMVKRIFLNHRRVLKVFISKWWNYGYFYTTPLYIFSFSKLPTICVTTFIVI